MNVLPNKVLAKELIKLPAGPNCCKSKRETLCSWSGHRVRSTGLIAGTGGFYLKHMDERHLGLAPKCLVVKKKSIRNIPKCFKKCRGWGWQKTDVEKLRQDDIRCHVSSFKAMAKRKACFSLAADRHEQLNSSSPLCCPCHEICRSFSASHWG